MIEIIEKSKCCGCSACVQKCPRKCITMIEDEEGFSYPKVNQSDCIDCGLCETVCPIQNKVEKRVPIIAVAAYNKNEDIRRVSSSGGIFTLLAETIIKKEGVVFGARFNEKWEVILDYSETMNGIGAFRGSKYVQASVGSAFQQCEQFLKQGKPVLFTGTPCQIAGLKLYLGKEYVNLLTVDVVCHGVPSPMVWRKYILELLKEHNTAYRAVGGKSTVLPSLDLISSIKDIKFRDKSDGWKKFSFVLDFAEVTADGKQSSVMSSIKVPCDDSLFMNAFISDLIIRPSCFKCPFRGVENRQSDLSIADFWGVEKLIPQMDDDKGTSLVMVNTLKGDDVFGNLDVISCKADVLAASQWSAGLMEELAYNKRRDRFFGKMKHSRSIVEQMKIHTLPETEYKKVTTPIWKKIARRVKKLVKGIIKCV